MKKTSVSIGNVAAGGDVTVAGGGIHVGHEATLIERAAAATPSGRLSPQVHNLLRELEEELARLQAAQEREDQEDPGELHALLNRIMEFAPHVIDVVLAALVDPLAALGIAVRKLAGTLMLEDGGEN